MLLLTAPMSHSATRHCKVCLVVQEVLSRAERLGGKWAEPGEEPVARVRHPLLHSVPVKVPYVRVLHVKVPVCWCHRAPLQTGAEEVARVQWEDRQKRNADYRQRMGSVRDR